VEGGATGGGFTPLRLYFGTVKGARVEGEARYEMTGLSPVERDELIVKLRNKGWSQAAIAQRLGMTQPGVLYALRRIAGIPRKRSDHRDDFAAETADDDDEQFWSF
jgi:hypothetical protein